MFFLVVLLFPSLLFGQIVIKATEAETGRPVAGAVITAGAQKAITNDHGLASFSSLQPGLKIGISAMGFKKAMQEYAGEIDTLLVALEAQPEQLQEVVVSGNMRPMTRLQSPIPVEVYNQQFFTRNVTPNVFEALSVANGIQPQLNCNVCNTGDIHINGLEGPYTMILIDGMPVVSSLSTVYGLMGIPNAMIKRMEVVKGPASTLYGSEAVAGLINIITKEPVKGSSFAADINHSSYQETSADIGLNHQMKKANVLLGLNAFHYGTKHDKNSDGFTDVTQQKRVSLFNKWAFERPANLQASFLVRLYGEERWGGQTNWSKQWAGSDSIYGESIATKRAEWLGKYSLTKDILAEASYTFHQQDSWYGSQPYNAVQHTAFAQLRWQKNMANHYVTLGIPFRFLHYDDNSVATQKPDGTNNADVQRITGLFLQDEWQPLEKLTILGGLRVEHHSLQGWVSSPRLAVKYGFNTSHTLRLSGGNGFRVVNIFTEDHAALTGAREVVIAEQLKPERSWNVNLNYGGIFYPGNSVLYTDLSVFYTRFSNKILPDYDTDPNQIIYRNLDGFGFSKGITFNTDLVAQSGIKASVGFTLMDVKNTVANSAGEWETEHQFQAPVFSATYALGYTIPKWKTTIDFTGKTNSPMRLPILPGDYRPEYSPWFTLANLQCTQPLSGSIDVYMAMKNIFNFFPSDVFMHPDDPFDKPGGKYWLTDGTRNPDTNPNGYSFDAAYNYAPLQKRRVIFGVRIAIN